jgi:hypothetical protein
MKRKIAITLLIANIALGAMVAWECQSAPKSHCQDGSIKTTTEHHKAVHYKCRNGEWVKD